MAQEGSERYFPLPFEDYEAGNLVGENGLLIDEKSKKLGQKADELLGKLESEFQYDQYQRHDFSIYTGTSGIALLKWFLYNKTGNKKYLKDARNIIDFALKMRKVKRLSFLAGDLGPIVIGIVLAWHVEDTNTFEHLLNSLLGYIDQCCQDPDIPDEMLYGRSGFLFSLLFVRKYCGSKYIKDSDLEKVCEVIIKSGQKFSRSVKSRSPLCYAWHNKQYTGAAHGYTGILYMLLQPDIVCLDVVKRSFTDIKGCIDYLLTLQFESGNLRRYEGNEHDNLIHWCHGAPGAVFVFTRAFEVFGDEKYLRAAETFGEVIWCRGLLRKGYGLCHGVCGNGYGHLVLYRITKDIKYLYRGVKFAEWCCDYGKHGCRQPDRPLSLYEGLAGTIFYLFDIRDPMNARFPGFEL